MKAWEIDELRRGMKGKWAMRGENPRAFNGRVCTDSRKAAAGDLFFADSQILKFLEFAFNFIYRLLRVGKAAHQFLRFLKLSLLSPELGFQTVGIL